MLNPKEKTALMAATGFLEELPCIDGYLRDGVEMVCGPEEACLVCRIRKSIRASLRTLQLRCSCWPILIEDIPGRHGPLGSLKINPDCPKHGTYSEAETGVPLDPCEACRWPAELRDEDSVPFCMKCSLSMVAEDLDEALKKLASIRTLTEP